MSEEKRILLVEDHPPNAEISCALLAEIGYQCDVACSGEDALEKVFKRPYSAVIMDLQMPGMDGLEATRRLRAREERENLSRVPVMGMTGNASEDDRIFCLKAGMDDFIGKPFRLKELEEKLVRLIQKP